MAESGRLRLWVDFGEGFARAYQLGSAEELQGFVKGLRAAGGVLGRPRFAIYEDGDEARACARATGGGEHGEPV